MKFSKWPLAFSIMMLVTNIPAKAKTQETCKDKNFTIKMNIAGKDLGRTLVTYNTCDRKSQESSIDMNSSKSFRDMGTVTVYLSEYALTPKWDFPISEGMTITCSGVWGNYDDKKNHVNCVPHK